MTRALALLPSRPDLAPNAQMRPRFPCQDAYNAAGLSVSYSIHRSSRPLRTRPGRHRSGSKIRKKTIGLRHGTRPNGSACGDKPKPAPAASSERTRIACAPQRVRQISTAPDVFPGRPGPAVENAVKNQWMPRCRCPGPHCAPADPPGSAADRMGDPAAGVHGLARTRRSSRARCRPSAATSATCICCPGSSPPT